MQLAGLHCMFCHLRICGELDAEFCSGCGGPRHLACRAKNLIPADGTYCPTCGVERAVVADALVHPRSALAPVSVLPVPLSLAAASRRMRAVLGCLEVAVISLVGGGAWVLSTAREWGPDRDLAGYIAALLIGVGLLAQWVCVGLYHGKEWARPAAVGLFVLMLPTWVSLPVAAIGLGILLDGRTWRAYRSHGSGAENLANTSP